MTTYAAAERQALVEALREAGPEAPTLCTGWTTHDLAAHLVAREHRPDAGAGLVLSFLAGYTEKVRRTYRERPYDELVELVRTGPPSFSPFAVPGVDAAANLGEHFVHCEDVRRAQPGWEPRVLDEGLQEALWSLLTRMYRMSLRRATMPVRLVRTDGAEISWGPAGRPVRLHGETSELVLYAYNRTSAAQVQIDGPPEAVARFKQTRMGL